MSFSSSVIKGGRWTAGVSVYPAPSWILTSPEEVDSSEGDAVFDISMAKEEILANAAERAREIIAAARSEADEVRDEAHRRGIEEGMAEAETRWRAPFEQLEDQIEVFGREREEFFRAAEPELAKLAVEIARKILKKELAQDSEAVLSVVRSALTRVRDREVRVRVNPSDLECVRGARESFLGDESGAADLEISPDRRVGVGGCIIETPSGNLDCRIETQLDLIAAALESLPEALLDDATGSQGPTE